MKVLSVVTLLLFSAVHAWARPPYQVICYALQTTMAPTNSVNDNGQGANINWTTNVPWQDLTVVSDAFAIPNTGNGFDMSETKNSALITPAHANGVRCILSIGGGSQDSAFSTLCQAANRQNFASAVTALVSQYGYDGVDIDWETPNPAAQSDTTAMMEDIYTKLKAMPNCSVDGKPHTLAFTTVDYIDTIYNMTTLGNYTDWCFFMGYDWGACPELATGPLNGIATEIQDLTDGNIWSYPISKMVMGCPLYADVYDSNCNAGEYDTLSILHLGVPGAYNTSYAEQAYTYGGQTVYVDTAQSYCDKTNWALNHGLYGIGMWDMAQALPYTDSTVAPIWNVIGGQSSCLNLGPTATPTKTATPVVASTWRVVAGGPAHTDCNNNVWAADENYTGGTPATSTNTITGALPCSTDQALNQDQRYGSSFSYTFNVPAGSYQVTLNFAETYWTAAGQRVFNVAVNGNTVLTNFDVYATAGGQNKAVAEVFNNIAPSGGVITITFGPASADNAMVSSIQVISQPGSPTSTPTKTATPSSTSTVTLTPTLTPTATPITLSTWRVNAGGPTYTDSQGNIWAADENFTSGTAAVTTSTITGALPASTDQTLYKSQRYGNPFSYTFNVPAGSYQITLKFAETYWTAAGQRVFNVSVNGTTVLTNFDIFNTAGGQNKAIDEVFNNIAPTGGVITITFGPASADNAMVDAIQIIPQPATATATSTFSKTATNTFTSTLTNTPTLTFSSTRTSTSSPTATATNSSTFTNTVTSTWTNSFTATATKTNSNTPTWTMTSTPSNTSTSAFTATSTVSSTATNTSVGTLTPVNTNTAVNTASPTNSGTPTASYTSSFTATSTSSTTNTLTFTATTTNTSTSTPAIPTSTKTYTFTPSATMTNTPTSTRTATPTVTNSFTPTLTATPTLTYTFTFTKTVTPTATWTNTSTWTSTPKVPTATNTFTVTPTYTHTAVPPTSTPTSSSACSGVPNWNGNFVAYSIGQKVVYNGELYQCIQAHTSESTWEPNVVPALWKALGSCGSTAPAPALAVAQPVVYPNPATSSTTTIQLPVTNATNVTVQILTVAMRQVQTINVPQVMGNTLTVQMADKSGVNLANGLYYFIIQADGQKWTNKVLVLR